MLRRFLSKAASPRGPFVRPTSDVGAASGPWPSDSGPAYAETARLAGLAARSPPPPPALVPASTVGLDGKREPILGGRAALDEALAVARAAVEEGQRVQADLREKERGAEVWALMADDVDRSFLESLALVVPIEAGEDDGAYEMRLRSAFESYRARLDRPSPSLMSYAPVPRARPKDSRRKPPTVYVLKRSEYRALKNRVWAAHRRRPNRAEMVEEAERLSHASA